MRAGDCIEVTASLVRVGSRSREMEFSVTVTTRAAGGGPESAAEVLEPALVATTARGVVVVPAKT
ncbi:hypothetical protein [Ornithinimicrobium sp. INDO-MA30-4]|uniref:hypothetical protein n=1 Tax=Ornithinimicrobium sp. INDO-MA30-4 TaxID=2908651 RepID=UPI0037CADF40